MAEKTIELLSPAGDMERLRMSLAYGADAVYLAGPDFGMRSFAGNFTPEELKQAVELCHSRGVAVHVTCNTMPRNDEAARLPEWLEFLQAAGVDAAILADVGVLSLLKKHAPGVKAHISTQASICNYETARAWHDLGASRVILARELEGKKPINFPRETAMGALALYISDESVVHFQPMNINFGLIPALGYRVKGKRNKNAALSQRALECLAGLGPL